MWKLLLNVFAAVIIFVAGAVVHSTMNVELLDRTVTFATSKMVEHKVAQHHKTRYFFNVAIPMTLTMSHVVDKQGIEYHFTDAEWRSGELHILEGGVRP